MASRRRFLADVARLGLALPWAGAARRLEAALGREPGFPHPGRPLLPDPRLHFRGESSAAALLHAGSPLPPARAQAAVPAPGELAARFADLRRHFVFEYYPWYRRDPWAHWDQWGRVPPVDIASNYVPRLGAYDSTDPAVVAQHARWIADSGAGAINLSWWGPGSPEDRAVPLVLDVMRDHGIKVAFHLEPYADDRARRLADDIAYLLREYGDKRGYDTLLLLASADGSLGPVFKAFRTILPETSTDCHGVTRPVPDYAADDLWRAQTDAARRTFRADFPLTLLADSLDVGRTRAAGFDGIAIYDPFVEPDRWAPLAAQASAAGLLFSFPVNAGFDAIEPRRIDPEGCYQPSPFLPASADAEFADARGREAAAAASAGRIRESFSATLGVQNDPALVNRQRGFLLAYVNSFNEWHEGTAFEPMRAAAALSPAEQVLGYHNPARGDYRLAAFTERMAETLAPARDLGHEHAEHAGPRWSAAPA